MSIASKQDDYSLKYEKIVVTYLDGSRKTFSPLEWAIFESRIKAMKTKKIEKHLKNKNDES